MKTRWLMTACATALLAFTSISAVAQDRNDQNRGQSQQDENRGQTKKQYRQFNEKQRQYARTYYNQHRDHPVFKQQTDGMTITSVGFSRATCSMLICGG